MSWALSKSDSSMRRCSDTRSSSSSFSSAFFRSSSSLSLTSFFICLPFLLLSLGCSIGSLSLISSRRARRVAFSSRIFVMTVCQCIKERQTNYRLVFGRRIAQLCPSAAHVLYQ
jgi:hypothetical protein